MFLVFYYCSKRYFYKAPITTAILITYFTKHFYMMLSTITEQSAKHDLTSVFLHLFTVHNVSSCVFCLISVSGPKASPRYLISWSFSIMYCSGLAFWHCPPCLTGFDKSNHFFHFFKTTSQMFLTHWQMLDWRSLQENKALTSMCFFQASGKTCGQ